MRAVNAEFIEEKEVVRVTFENGCEADYDIHSQEDSKWFDDEVKQNHCLLSPFQGLFDLF